MAEGSYPDDLSYTTDHEWVRVDGDTATVGITAFAQQQLGDVVYVDLPAAGAAVERGQPFGEVESTKSVSDLYAPLTGTILERNENLEERPELVNQEPYGDGWMVRISLSDTSETGDLLSASDYTASLEA